jgi:ribonuclease P protein component
VVDAESRFCRINERFSKDVRLRRRWQYLEVQNGGHRITSRFFIGLVVFRSSDSLSRIGITATTRYANAVGRNRIKRLAREAFRKKILALPAGCDLVVIPKKHAKMQQSRAIFKDLHLLGENIANFAETI